MVVRRFSFSMLANIRETQRRINLLQVFFASSSQIRCWLKSWFRSITFVRIVLLFFFLGTNYMSGYEWDCDSFVVLLLVPSEYSSWGSIFLQWYSYSGSSSFSDDEGTHDEGFDSAPSSKLFCVIPDLFSSILRQSWVKCLYSATFVKCISAPSFSALDSFFRNYNSLSSNTFPYWGKVLCARMIDSWNCFGNRE